MNRRSFLRLFGAAIPAATLDRKYFFAPVGGWESDVIIAPTLAEMAGLVPASVLALQLEKVRNSLPELFFTETRLFSQIQGNKVLSISHRPMRVPFQVGTA